MAKSKPVNKDTPKFSSFKPKGKNPTAEVKLGNHRVTKRNENFPRKPRRTTKDARADWLLHQQQNQDQKLRPSLDRDIPMRTSKKASANPKYDRRDSGELRRALFDRDREETDDHKRKADGEMGSTRKQSDHTTAEPDYTKLRNSDLFTIDLKGDNQNLTYGVNKWKVPTYRLYGGGSIVGLDPSIKIDFAQSTDRYYVLKYPPGPFVVIHKVAKPAARVAIPDVDIDALPGVHDGGEDRDGFEDDYIDMEMEEFRDPGMGMVTAK